jgi:hypothetical protein
VQQIIRKISKKERGEDVQEDKKTLKTYDLKGKSDPRRVRVTKREDGDFDVVGDRIEEIARMTDLRYVDGVNRIYDVMEKLGVIRKVKSMVVAEMSE